MAQTVRSAKMDSRNARKKLAVRPNAPYFIAIEHGRAVGYRKSRAGGSWVARLYLGDRQYAYEHLGAADDILDADGVAVLDFAQAQAAAREWFTRWADGQRPQAEVAPYTVADACDDYMIWFRANRKSVSQTKATVEGHIRKSAIAGRAVADLTPNDLRAWLMALAETPRRLRRKTSAAEVRLAAPPDTPEEKRRRQSSANRILNVLKAVLNRAVAEWDEKRRGEAPSTKAWDAVNGFREADAARVRFLSTDEARRLVNASAPDFRRMVRGALHTGARYGELSRLTVGDFRNGKVFVARSKGAKSRWISLDAEGRAFFDQITAGQPGEALIFRRDDGDAWGKTHQSRRIDEACKAAAISPRCTFHELRHTYASLALMAGMPIMVLAQNLGHSDTRMVEKHYGHLIQSYKDEKVEEFAPKFGFGDEVSVKKFGA